MGEADIFSSSTGIARQSYLFNFLGRTLMQNKIDKYWILWPLWMLSGIVYFPIRLYYKLFTELQDPIPKWIRWWGNRVDNLTDWVVESLHCRRIPWTNSELNMSRLMNNRTSEGKWIRPYKISHYRNCFPK